MQVRKILLSYIQQARGADSRTESAKELKKMILFNSLVVTQLVADIKGEDESSDSLQEEPIKEEEKQTFEEEEWETVRSLQKVKPNRENVKKQIQTEITLKDDLPDRDRTDLYKTYLLFCLTGEVKMMPFGGQLRVKRDDDSEFVLLSQLASILGMSNKEIVDVHRGLAEQTFRQQAEVILTDGQITKARMEQLNDLQKKVGLPPPYAQKIIKNITTSKLSGVLETAVGQGRISMKEIRELREAGVEINTMVSESLRENLFKKAVDDIFSSGTGEFDEEEVYEKMPADLSINAEKAKAVVQQLARTRLSNSLVQAVALLRQRNQKGVV